MRSQKNKFTKIQNWLTGAESDSEEVELEKIRQQALAAAAKTHKIQKLI